MVDASRQDLRDARFNAFSRLNISCVSDSEHTFDLRTTLLLGKPVPLASAALLITFAPAAALESWLLWPIQYRAPLKDAISASLLWRP